MHYSAFKIKTYDYWDLFLHKNQFSYIGRCYAAAIREDAILMDIKEKIKGCIRKS